MQKNALTRAAHIRLMIFDVDGILTNGQLHFGAEGELFKTFHVQDGLGIRLLQQSGVATALISARTSPIVARRAADLGIHHVFQGIHDKRTAFDTLLAQTGLAASACGFMGDDLIDLPVLLQVGLAVSVPNAHIEVQKRVHYITQAAGGNGAVRELCDLILHAQGNFDALLAPYLAQGNTTT